MSTTADRQLFERAIASLQMGALDEAERGLLKFLQRNPKHFGALNVFGMLLTRQARYGEAETVMRRAIGVDGRSDATFYNYGIVLKALNRPKDALEAFSKAIAINPSVPESWNNRGTVLNDLKRFDDALRDFDRAIALKPEYAEVLLNMGNSLTELRRHDEALAAYERALTIKPDLAEAWSGRGNVLFKLGRTVDALESFENAAAIKPSLDYLAGMRLHLKLQLGDWRDFDRQCVQIIGEVRAGRPAARPFDILTIPSSARDQLECARIFVRNLSSAQSTRRWQRERYRHDRIRLAYVSADFREHAVAHLAAGLFEEHDRARFETIAVSLNPTDGSELRTRLEGAFEHFVDASHLDSEAVARKLREFEADIAVDLMGFTAGARPEIFAFRPCPIQVSYLGFAATMGADFIDYVIADRLVIPEDQRPHFSEQAVILPDTFLPYDSKQRVSDQTPKRDEQGLPETGFIFCAFNMSYKITPPLFDIWMRLLRAIEGSALWLSGTHESAARNLRREAEARGVDAERLIFTKRLARMEDHLARHRLAHLFLDTMPYNAHSTAAAALWAGLPVLTCRGETFAGRVAASLLNAAGLPELVTTNLADYEALALKLAREPALLAEIRAKLAGNRDTYALFDTARLTRHIEAAYTTMWEIFQRGDAPKSFAVSPL